MLHAYNLSHRLAGARKGKGQHMTGNTSFKKWSTIIIWDDIKIFYMQPYVTSS